MKRVVVTRQMVGICHMQVCAVNDATNDEILSVCRRENLAGTENNWADVIREGEGAPVPCDDDPERTHFLVVC